VSAVLFLRYLRSNDDLIPVEARAELLGIREAAQTLWSPPTTNWNQVQSLAQRAGNLPQFQQASVPHLWRSETRFPHTRAHHDFTVWNDAAHAIARSWDENTRSDLEAGIDAIGLMRNADFSPMISN
jgi:hypothetical protein